MIGRMYVTIGEDGEPRRVYTDRAAADRDARKLALSVLVVVPEAQVRRLVFDEVRDDG